MDSERKIIAIPMDKVIVHESNVRKDLSDGQYDSDIGDLAKSIESLGLLQPVTVVKSGDQYRIIAGQRRYLAHDMLGATTIDAIVRDSDDELDLVTVSLVENVHRADMTPMDKTTAIKSLFERLGSVKKVSQQVNLGAATVKKYLSLDGLSDSLKASLEAGDVKNTEVLSSLAKKFDDPAKQEQVWSQIKGFRSEQQKNIIKHTMEDLDNLGEEIGWATSQTFEHLQMVGDHEVVIPIDLLKSLIDACSDEAVAGIAISYLPDGLEHV